MDKKLEQLLTVVLSVTPPLPSPASPDWSLLSRCHLGRRRLSRLHWEWSGPPCPPPPPLPHLLAARCGSSDPRFVASRWRAGWCHPGVGTDCLLSPGPAGLLCWRTNGSLARCRTHSPCCPVEHQDTGVWKEVYQTTAQPAHCWLGF